MDEKTLHEKLIDELLDPRSSLTERENAAANEIRSLREQLVGQAKSEKKAKAKADKEQKIMNGAVITALNEARYHRRVGERFTRARVGRLCSGRRLS